MPKRSPRKILNPEKESLLRSPALHPPVIRVTPAKDAPATEFSHFIPDHAAPARGPVSRSSMEHDVMQHDSCSLTAKEIYRLSSDGQINIDDPDWTEKLCSAIFANDVDLCEAVLCCGVPVTAKLLDSIPVSYEEVKTLCAKFYPDMWSAVQTGNVKQVRCLVNLWHTVSLVRNGKPLFQLAIEHSNPYIISLIGGIQSTMEVAHLVLAGHTEKLKTIRSSGPFIRRTLKHFGRNCAPILYFAMMQNDPALVSELCEHFGLKSDDEMLDQDGAEIPLLFAALQAALDVKIIAAFLQHTNRELQNIWYQRRNVLQYAIDLQVSVEIFATLLEFGGARLVADRDVTNRSLVDLITERETNEALNGYRLALDKQIKIWIKDSSSEAIWLAVLGFEMPFAVEAFEELAVIQDRISSMDECIDNDDVQCFEQLLQFDLSFEEWPNLAWYGRPVGNGLPLLNRAVIWNRREIVDLILTQADMSSVPLDNFGASALHYSCAATDYEDVERLLLCAGFGEHYMDKSDHDSASYRMKRDSAAMLHFLQALTDKDGTMAAELDPWSLAVDAVNLDNDDDAADLPFRKRILTPPDFEEKSPSRKSSTHSHGKAMGALPDSWCSLS